MSSETLEELFEAIDAILALPQNESTNLRKKHQRALTCWPNVLSRVEQLLTDQNGQPGQEEAEERLLELKGELAALQALQATRQSCQDDINEIKGGDKKLSPGKQRKVRPLNRKCYDIDRQVRLIFDKEARAKRNFEQNQANRARLARQKAALSPVVENADDDEDDDTSNTNSAMPSVRLS
jgi:chromosome segregation ATPase